MSARKPEEPRPLITVRLTLSEALAWWEEQGGEPDPRNLVISVPFIEMLVYPDLVTVVDGAPEPQVSPELREAIVGALAEALVRRYRRDERRLHPVGGSGYDAPVGIHP